MPKEDKFERFDCYLTGNNQENPWQPDGSFESDFELLQTLLRVAVGTAQRSGIVAAAADAWAAEQLRRAGFHADEVWPRRSRPRVLPRDVRNIVANGLTKKLRAEVEARYEMPGARKALPAEARVRGSAYTKQGDVVIASWAAGVEVLISTKTMLSSYGKNLRNRFEEGYGDAKNLRGRHPLSSLGFLFVAGADIPKPDLIFAVDMLRKLASESDVYDCTCLLLIESNSTIEEERDPEGDLGEPSSLRVEDEVGSDEDAVDSLAQADIDLPDDPSVSLVTEGVPPDLSADTFFERLINKGLTQMPVAVYEEVRRLQASPVRTP